MVSIPLLTWFLVAVTFAIGGYSPDGWFVLAGTAVTAHTIIGRRRAADLRTATVSRAEIRGRGHSVLYTLIDGNGPPAALRLPPRASRAAGPAAPQHASGARSGRPFRQRRLHGAGVLATVILVVLIASSAAAPHR